MLQMYRQTRSLSSKTSPLWDNNAAKSSGLLYCFGKLIVIGIKNKTTPDLSIVKRLGGSRAAKVSKEMQTAKFGSSFSPLHEKNFTCPSVSLFIDLFASVLRYLSNGSDLFPEYGQCGIHANHIHQFLVSPNSNGQFRVQFVELYCSHLVLVCNRSQQPVFFPVFMPLHPTDGKQGKEYERATDTSPDIRIFVPDMRCLSVCNRCLKKLAAAAGIKKNVSYHTNDHTFATLSLAAGGDLYTVGKLLGHTSINSTQVYADVVMETKIEAVNRISEFFSN